MSLAPRRVPAASPLAAASAKAIPSLQIHLAKSQSPEYDRHWRALAGQSRSLCSGNRLQTLPAALCAPAPPARAEAVLEPCCWCGAWGVTSPLLPEGSPCTLARAGWAHAVATRLDRDAGVCGGEGPRGCGPCAAATCDAAAAPLGGRSRHPQASGLCGEGNRRGSSFERRGEAATISAPYLPRCLAQLSMDPNVIRFKFFRFRLWPP